MSRLEPRTTLPWLAGGTSLFLRQLALLPDSGFTGPSALPGWTRAHVAAHVARNADALGRLLTWARTGAPTPMYADAHQRAAEIADGARQPVSWLRREVVSTAEQLDVAMAALPEAAWTAEVRSAKGRLIPAAEVPWMRVREVWLHAVDLGTGASAHDFPSAVVAAFLDDVTGAFAARDDAPRLRLVAVDLETAWSIGEGTVEVSGEGAELLAWLTGRSRGGRLQGSDLVAEIPAWL